MEEQGQTLRFVVTFEDDRREEVLRLKVEDELLRLFLFYSFRAALYETRRRKKWRGANWPTVLDVVLGRMEVPVFRTSERVRKSEYEMRMIQLVMEEFKGPHLSDVEREIEETDQRIDELVYALYGITKEERTLVVEELR